jgi:isopentenyl-diphosphate delta-isomerase
LPEKSPDEASQTRSRKEDHVDIILKEDVRARANAWDDVKLAHEALPDVDLPAVDLRTRFLGAALGAPIMVASMTGGYADAERINGNLAAAAAEHGFAMGVGSQRAALLSAQSRRTYTVVRDHDVPFVAANIGGPQLVPQGGRKPLARSDVEALVKMLEADALIVHLNALQESVQPEGDLRSAGLEAALADLARDLGVPVIAKETGAGMTRATANRLKAAGVKALDVGGLSGTTFAAVEAFRARAEGRVDRERVGALYRDWGVPTPVALREAQVGLPVVATGGLRSGLDAARALALGATLAGYASAFLRAADQGEREAIAFGEQLQLELRTACFLTDCARASELATHPVVVVGETRTWLAALGHDVDALARRW